MRKKKQENSLESLGVGTTPPPLPSLLHDQTQPGLFSREKEEAGNKVWSPWTSGQLPHASRPCCVTRLNQGYSLVRKKKQGKSLESLGRRDNFPIPSPPCCVTRLNQGYSLVRRKKQGTKFGVPGRRENFPTLPSLLRDQTQPGFFFSCERRSRQQSLESNGVARTSPFPLLPAP